ncbi:hypothetical protein F8388_024134 [Cannabis sativa]|uniref:Uncharacterized protein n=1 Tax=Cannabis sativa TaxID=3483 RepID=A0A7J6FXQ1_CANSA|nr:hypothetical protein F8388_024134 [Cannabis sativa]
MHNRSGKYGSVTEEIEGLLARSRQLIPLFNFRNKSNVKEVSKFRIGMDSNLARRIDFFDLEDESNEANEVKKTPVDIICIDSDEEAMEAQKPSYHPWDESIKQPCGVTVVKDIGIGNHNVEDSSCHDPETKLERGVCVDIEVEDEGSRSSVKDKDDIENEDNHQTGVKETDDLEDEGSRQTGFKDNGDLEIEGDDQSSVKDDDDLENESSHQTSVKDSNDLDEAPCTDSKTRVDDASLHGEGDKKPSPPLQRAVLSQLPGETFAKDIEVGDHADSKSAEEDSSPDEEIESEIKKDYGIYLGVNDVDESGMEDDGLEDAWNEMSMALELTKELKEKGIEALGLSTTAEQFVSQNLSFKQSDPVVDHSSEEEKTENEEKCEHSFILKDDLGYVCRICGIIDKEIEMIFEFRYKDQHAQLNYFVKPAKGLVRTHLCKELIDTVVSIFTKQSLLLFPPNEKVVEVRKSTRTYVHDRQEEIKDKLDDIVKPAMSREREMLTTLFAHPSHLKIMKAHQKEGFGFLVSNLMGDEPGGCILAHAPGSGKTFMIISFLQSFLKQYPDARPLVVLPKGIMETWKTEFRNRQIEDIPLYDIYKVKGSRAQQLEVPSILILDEGHTPRNDNTDVFQTLARVRTPRKVVLSGTLYQNHVNEVFNVLNLVRPRFLSLKTSRPIVKRIMSKADLSSGKRQPRAWGDAAFFEAVEHTIQKDQDFRRKVSVIQDLREMTNKVLHYYKGDFLDELPGLLDFTVLLNLSSKQKHELEKIKKLGRFKASSVGGLAYLHPALVPFSDKQTDGNMLDEVVRHLDVNDGVKTKFFLNILNLCEAKKEKLLVFSQYLDPLDFLQKLAMKEKGWQLDKEIVFISGKSTQNSRDRSMVHFNNSPNAKVFFGSIKACGEGISLVGASRIIILDVHLNPSVTRQAIGRAFRPGQKKRVVSYRLVAADSPEEEDYQVCSRKELVSKMWFEWKEYCGYKDFEVETVDVNKCGDEFLECSQKLAEDIKVLYKRLELKDNAT